MADDIEFVSDEDIRTDIANHVAPGGKEGLQLKRKSLAAMSAASSDGESDEDVEKESMIRPVALYIDSPFSGKDVFGFKTPKRAGALAQAASEALHVKTPRMSKRVNATKSAGKNDRSAGTRNVKAARNTQVAASRVRSSRRLKGAFQGTEYQDSDEEDPNDVCPSDSDSLSDAKLTSTVDRHSKPESSTNDVCDILDEYFHQQSSKCVTSDRTLANLNMPQMDQQSLVSHLSMVSSSHARECSQIYLGYRTLFHHWLFLLRNAFNLLLYGLGSKRTLLDQFRSSVLHGQSLLVVNGFFPSLTLKHILNSITQDLLQHKGTFKSVTEQCDFIKGNLREDLFLVIHNIDGAMLRAGKTQTILSILAEMDSIHLIASIDHINAPLIWDQTQSSRFNWLWYDVTTFESYSEETSYENSLLVQQSGALALSSLTHVFRSLTPNARGIFILIANHQLEEKDCSSYNGLSFHDCYTKCREKFLVNSDLTLRAQLTEFRDHKLLRSKKVDGVEHLYIPVDASTLQQFVEDHVNNNV